MVVLGNGTVNFSSIRSAYGGSSSDVKLSDYYMGGRYVTNTNIPGIPSSPNSISVSNLKGKSSTLSISTTSKTENGSYSFFITGPYMYHLITWYGMTPPNGISVGSDMLTYTTAKYVEYAGNCTISFFSVSLPGAEANRFYAGWEFGNSGHTTGFTSFDNYNTINSTISFTSYSGEAEQIALWITNATSTADVNTIQRTNNYNIKTYS